jgi:hypothetical protein
VTRQKIAWLLALATILAVLGMYATASVGTPAAAAATPPGVQVVCAVYRVTIAGGQVIAAEPLAQVQCPAPAPRPRKGRHRRA